MNGTVKYKAWIPSLECMVDVLLLDMEYKDIGYNEGEDRILFDLDDVELMRFMGYKDKNGVEIYKGYILKALMVIGKGIDLDKRRNVELKTVFFEVDYIQGAFLLRGININNNILVNCLFMDKDYYKERIRGSAHYTIDSEKDKYYRFDDFEVVGNRFENKELLEAEG